MSRYFYSTIEFPTIGGDPLDASHNTFAWVAPDSISNTQACDGVHDALQEFFNVTPAGGTVHLSALFGLQLSRASDACVIKVYDITAHLNGSPHGSPIGIRTLTLSASSGMGPSLPEGVAAALSFHGAYGTDVEFGPGGTRPRARDRGRIYFGPVDYLGFSEDATSHRIYVSAGLQLHLASAATRMAANGYPSSGDQVSWCVWSRANARLESVVGGWVDDRFDYQRRREDPGLARRLWP